METLQTYIDCFILVCISCDFCTWLLIALMTTITFPDTDTELTSNRLESSVWHQVLHVSRVHSRVLYHPCTLGH